MSSRPNLSSPAAAAALAASNNMTPNSYQQNPSATAQYSSTNAPPQGQSQSASLAQQQQLQQSSASSGSQVVGLHYKIGKKIGEGSFGVIFEGTNLINGIPVAIKFEPRKTEAPQLRDEYRTYKHLNGLKGIPSAYYFGQEGLHNILVIDLLGPSLEDLFDWCGRKFSVKTVAQVAVQMITLIQSVHERDLIYRDIKPDNFLIGRHGLPDENSVHLVDFGMAKQYRDPRTKQHIPYREKKSLSGTARYMSVNTHLGREQSRRDDLEALGHVFFYFLKGQLPWQGLKAPTNKQKYEKIGEKKRTTSVLDLCQGFPRQFAQYLESVRNLQFDAEPDYDGYRKLIMSVFDDIGEVADGHYDWMDLNGGRGWDATINKKPNLHGYGHPTPPGERHRHSQQRRPRNSQQPANATGNGPQALSAAAIPGKLYRPHDTQSSDRPLPNLPDKNGRFSPVNQGSPLASQQAQQYQYQNIQQQPQATNEPVKTQQQVNGKHDGGSNKSSKGFLAKIFGCCV
ncbi:hypothetical protein OGAPHI_004340 [Ogataea philodendri]|uniref:non-specific serine/threonine protein kinase n=1 Tax=Ogataea philodendri TaxID=1378263 RepID=A0A9P8T4V8_9ASCO|nr:uncharacterized protein OGAPHI_004340 [Ogataea philodendri]KAH3666151.1 hypothetical protein OGAPHI_004340 [Ogataea philodendri]